MLGAGSDLDPHSGAAELPALSRLAVTGVVAVACAAMVSRLASPRLASYRLRAPRSALRAAT